MVMDSWRAAALVSLAAAAPVSAQYVGTPPPSQTDSPPASTSNPYPPPQSAAARAEEVSVTPRKGQSEQQTWSDRYECHRWARDQSGFDPTQVAAQAADTANQRNQYRRAFTACLDAKGYTVHYGATTTAAAPVTPPAGTRTPPRSHWVSNSPTLNRDPLTFSIEGGYTIAAGSTRQLLDNGSNVGFGLTWFPVRSFPVGLRVNGSYSSFDAKDALINRAGGPGYNAGRERIYGGEADLQLDLAHQSSRSKLYLFGGAGWYREQTRLRQVSLVDGAYCDFFGYCWPGLVPVVTAYSRTTTNWRSSWNAGLGWEVALADHASFFVEARYQWIAPHTDQVQLVPIRIGLRF